MLDKVQRELLNFVDRGYFGLGFSGVRLSGGKLIAYNEDGSVGDFTGIQDNNSNYVYIRVLTDGQATNESISTCGSKVMQANLRLVAIAWDTNIYLLSGFLASRIVNFKKYRVKINSTNLDYDSIWNAEMINTDAKRYNGMSVVSVDISVKYNLDNKFYDSPCALDLCEDVKVCKDGFVILKDEDGNIILEQVVPSGVTVEKTVNLQCLDADAVLKDTAGGVISVTDIPSGATQDIIAPDAEAILKDTLGTVISVNNIVSGGSEDIIAPDAEAVIKNTLGIVISTNNIPSGASEDIIILDSQATLKDTAGNIISVNNIVSQASVDIIAPNGTINLVNTVNTPIASLNVRSGEIKPSVIANVAWTDSDGSGESTPYGNAINCTPITPLFVDFSASKTNPVTHESITFTDLSTGATNWLWNFGDGTTSTLQNPAKIYFYAGAYTVTLAASNPVAGGFETKVAFINVTLQSIVATNLQAHYRALEGVAPSNATLVLGDVSQWNDSTANAFHVTQGTAANRPIYSINEITAPNGSIYGGAIFDGINDFLANASAGFVRSPNSTMFLLFKISALATSGTRGLFTTVGLQAVLYNFGNPQIRMQSGAIIDTGMAYPLNNYFVLRVQFSNSGNAQIRMNSLITRAVANTGAVSTSGFAIGGNNAGSAQSSITFIEGAIYSANPTSGDVTNILEYFKSKFGLWV